MEKNRILFIKRLIMSFCGVIICAVCVGFFKFAAFGVDPFQSVMSGLDMIVPLDFGTMYVIANIILLAFALLTDRHYIGIATFINLFLLGYITQFTYDLLRDNIADPSLTLRIACLVIGLIVLSFSLSLYITADLGVSTYDAIALVIVNKWKIGKFKYVRIISDVVCVCLGASLFLIGGGKVGDIPTVVGIGTIATAFFMGPMIEFFNVRVARQILGIKE